MIIVIEIINCLLSESEKIKLKKNRNKDLIGVENHI